MGTIYVTQDQALKAFRIIETIVAQAWPNGEKTATQIVLPHEVTKDMRELIEEVRKTNDRRNA